MIKRNQKVAPIFTGEELAFIKLVMGNTIGGQVGRLVDSIYFKLEDMFVGSPRAVIDDGDPLDLRSKKRNIEEALDTMFAESPTEMTVDEISNALGKTIKIIGDK